jgi:anti-sigma factor RsiW
VTDDTEHVTEDLAAYALGSLEPGEHARVDAHVALCASCAGRLADYRGLVGVLPLALTPVPPPPDLWNAIRANARRAETGPPVRTRAALTAGWLRAARWLAVGAVGIGLIGWNLRLQTELSRYAHGPQVEKLARRPARLIILGGAAQPQATARIFAAIDGESGHMAISGLPPLPASRVYQLWFVPQAAAPALTAAVFTVDGEGRAWVVIRVPANLDATRALIVTEEAATGSSAPTGPALLEARQWR